MWWFFPLPPLTRCNFPREDHHPFYKPSFSYQRYHHFHPRANFHRREHFHPKPHHVALKEREREKEKERYEQSKSTDGSSPPKQSSSKFMSAAKQTVTVIQTSREVRGRFVRADVVQTKALLNFIERYLLLFLLFYVVVLLFLLTPSLLLNLFQSR